MAGQRTESPSEAYRGLDRWPSQRLIATIVAAQRAAIDAVAAAAPALAAAADAAAERLRAGGRLVYAGAGSSGLLAQVDALELPGTYGIAADSVPVLLAGGPEGLLAIPSGAEDDEQEAEAGVDALDVGPKDVLVAISASGSTPFAVAALRRARARGALTVGIACNPGTALVTESDLPILVETPPEVIAGSTRMNAGTAQKCVLNALSTAMAVRLGHAFDGLMVNVRPENEKLRRRALAIVARASGCSPDAATAALAATGNDVKAAILVAAGGGTGAEARDLLESCGGDVRASLDALADRRHKAG